MIIVITTFTHSATFPKIGFNWDGRLDSVHSPTSLFLSNSMKPSLKSFKAIASQFGSYSILHPSHLRHTPPLQVPPHIVRPSYLASNFFTRKEGEPLSEVKDEDEEKGLSRGYGTSIVDDARIRLGGDEEAAVRTAGRTVGEVMGQVEALIRVSWFLNHPTFHYLY